MAAEGRGEGGLRGQWCCCLRRSRRLLSCSCRRSVESGLTLNLDGFSVACGPAGGLGARADRCLTFPWCPCAALAPTRCSRAQARLFGGPRRGPHCRLRRRHKKREGPTLRAKLPASCRSCRAVTTACATTAMSPPPFFGILSAGAYARVLRCALSECARGQPKDDDVRPKVRLQDQLAQLKSAVTARMHVMPPTHTRNMRAV